MFHPFIFILCNMFTPSCFRFRHFPITPPTPDLLPLGSLPVRLSMLRMSLGPASQKTVTNDLMLSAARLARKHPGVRLHTHLAENQVRVVQRPEEERRRSGGD